MKPRYLALAVITVLSFLPLKAQTTVAFSFDSAGVAIRDFESNFLADGSPIQLGYYSAATSIDLFAGDWNPVFDFTINGVEMEEGPGLFFHAGVNITASIPLNQIMAVRFYDSVSVAGSIYYGAVSTADSNGGLIWPGTANIMLFQIGNPGTTWLNDHVAFTGTPIPEPAAFAAFSALAALGLAATRRRRA